MGSVIQPSRAIEGTTGMINIFGSIYQGISEVLPSVRGQK